MAYTDIDKSDDYFNTVLYSGTGSSQSITGVGFQPDWIWFKCRQANNHNLFDVIRGSNKIIQSSTSNAEATSAALLTSFDSDGFTVNTDDGVNGSGKTYASWNWLAGGTASSNTDGSITSNVSASTTSGFSISSYTGTGSTSATIGHGLGVKPKVVIVKRRESGNWFFQHGSLGATKNMVLNSTNAEATFTSCWNDTEPTSSVFTVGNNNDVNASGGTYIAYCFAEKKGFSKFGSYTGNGSTDGIFVYTGFKPAWFMIKRTSSTESWYIHDNKRDTFNPSDKHLLANSLNAEVSISSLAIDLLSNGIKIRSTDTGYNAAGSSYIYMAFAENPFVTSTGIPGLAR